MTKLTNMEKHLIESIPEDCFYEFGFESELWTDAFLECTMGEGKKNRGVLSSLKKKGYINIDKEEGIMSLTAQGIEYIKECGKFNLDENGYVVR